MDNQSHTATWVKPDDIIRSEIRQSQEDKYHPSLLVRGPWSSQVHGDRQQNGGCQGLGGGGSGKLMFNGYRVSVLQDKNVLETCCTAMWRCLLLKCMVKMVNFMCLTTIKNKQIKESKSNRGQESAGLEI